MLSPVVVVRGVLFVGVVVVVLGVTLVLEGQPTRHITIAAAKRIVSAFFVIIPPDVFVLIGFGFLSYYIIPPDG